MISLEDGRPLLEERLEFLHCPRRASHPCEHDIDSCIARAPEGVTEVIGTGLRFALVIAVLLVSELGKRSSGRLSSGSHLSSCAHYGKVFRNGYEEGREKIVRDEDG